MPQWLSHSLEGNNRCIVPMVVSSSIRQWLWHHKDLVRRRGMRPGEAWRVLEANLDPSVKSQRPDHLGLFPGLRKYNLCAHTIEF